MSESNTALFTAFVGDRLIGRGTLRAVAQAAHAYRDEPLLVFEDASGRPVDLDLQGGVEDVLARLTPKPLRGRPKLGVTAREVTLLPRQWDWLATQPGGASATLRRLIDEARRDGRASRRQAQEATHRVMTAMAGDLAGYEDALRALYAGDGGAFERCISAWPSGIADYVRELAGAVSGTST